MDIAPELLNRIQNSFREGYTRNKKIASIVSKVGAGKGTGADSAAFATEVGNELKRAVSENVQPDNLPDERMYYNIAEKIFPPLLKKNHELINAVSKEVAKTTAQKAGLNLNGLDVPTDKNKIEGIVKHASKGEKYKSVKKSTENSLVNYSQGVNDESVKKNAEFLGNSGVKAYIIRTTTGKCCEWCTNIAGKYEYGQEPKDIYRRHANCDCVVEYVTDGKSQNVHSKQWKDKEAIQERKGIEPSRPSKEEVEKLKNFGLDNGGKGGIIKENKEDNRQATPHNYMGVEQTTKITKKGNENDFSVDRNVVNSKKFHDKFEGLTEHKAVNESLYQESMKMLEHRDGTDREDLVAIDAKTGAIVAKNTASTKSGSTGFTKEQYEAVNNNENDVILLHNHPNSSRPSFTDIKTLFDNDKVSASVVPCHDGDVYSISEPKRDVDISSIYNKYRKEYIYEYQNSEIADVKALNAVYESGGFKYERR